MKMEGKGFNVMIEKDGRSMKSYDKLTDSQKISLAKKYIKVNPNG